ncbi:MAG: gamma-glutamyltransferase [Hyphomicrobiaceae bacterium]|nr:gamma-glutamyltransferase [Hyphomicrobiaceae bacterium]
MPTARNLCSPNVSLRRAVTKPSTRSKGGIVVTQNRAASVVGARVLKEGGNAVDAAIAAAFAVGVVEPWMSGIGGVGAMLHRHAKTGKVTAIDFGGRSPKALRMEDFKLAGGSDEGNMFGWPAVVGNINTVGAKAIVAPTEPKGMALAHTMLGSKPWSRLLAPAIKLAEDGLVVDHHTTLMVANALADLQKDAGTKERFLRGGLPPIAPAPQTGLEILRLPCPALARTLKAIAADGAEAMYKGPLARAIADDVQALGGYLSTEDLAAVRAVEREPLSRNYRDHTFTVLPELNGGPTLLVALEHLARHGDMPGAAPDGARFVAYGRALEHAWEDRFRRMGDAGERSLPTSTTHLSVIDADGNIVTLTQTLLSLFGSRVVLPQSGILMNNGINWFDPRPGGPNGLAPDKRGLSNYVPTLMVKGDTAVGIGGCGGRRIIPAVFQLLAMMADFGFDLDTAFHTPRIDVSGGAAVTIDRRLAAETKSALSQAFDTVEVDPLPHPTSFTIAGAVRRHGGYNEGATEPQQPWSEAVSEDDV